MSNLSVFERNVLHGFQALDDPYADEAEALFLRFKDRGALRSERCAYRWAETVAPRVDAVLAASARVQPGCRHVHVEVRAFLLERHARTFFPDGRAA